MKRAFSSAVAASARADGSRHACVIGWPITHSRSPLIHGYWLKAYGIEGSYTKEAVRPEELGAFLASLAERGFVGCNVTVPHKEAAFAAAVVKHPSAVAVGAANTLWLQDAVLHAANTDTYGYMTYLDLKAPGWNRAGAPVSVLGAGGAARAIVYGFLEAGVSEVRVFNRSRERADALAEVFGPRVKAIDWVQRAALSRGSSVLVNTTTLGLKGEGDPGVDFAGFDPRCVVSDIVYVPLETAFLASARAAGLKTVDGLGMLLHQAVPGFERWFGRRPDVTDELYRLIAADIAGA
jgi:shikimate dehydrogenase